MTNKLRLIFILLLFFSNIKQTLERSIKLRLYRTDITYFFNNKILKNYENNIIESKFNYIKYKDIITICKNHI
jgi:hypothetical protein